jgi:uncharacterized membrane protein YeaQ/YmgE (transglycosylase-associated protein family)
LGVISAEEARGGGIWTEVYQLAESSWGIDFEHCLAAKCSTQIGNKSQKEKGECSMYIVWWIIVGLIAGFITGKIMKGSGFGALMDIVVGIVGAIVGGFIMRALGYAGQGGMIYTILVAVLGAVILTWLIRLVTGKT